MLIKTSLSYRSAFLASQNRVLYSADFSNQEARIAADISSDNAMIQAFTAPEFLTQNFEVDGVLQSITYANPAVDLHTQTAIQSYSDVFINVPKYKLIEVASSTVRDGVNIRKAGKITNFGVRK